MMFEHGQLFNEHSSNNSLITDQKGTAKLESGNNTKAHTHSLEPSTDDAEQMMTEKRGAYQLTNNTNNQDNFSYGCVAMRQYATEQQSAEQIFGIQNI